MRVSVLASVTIGAHWQLAAGIKPRTITKIERSVLVGTLASKALRIYHLNQTVITEKAPIGDLCIRFCEEPSHELRLFFSERVPQR
jgi:hypothetical protein